jgi:ApbE superfamily uncharacterized protein (UPF0280 family)
MNSDRFRFFSSVYRESDLWIGVSQSGYTPGMGEAALEEQQQLYRLIETHESHFPGFVRSLEPLIPPREAKPLPAVLGEMYRIGRETGTGPMSCVAGMFAREVAGRLLEEYPADELVVENGGDVHVRNTHDLFSVIHAGPSVLSGKLGLVITPGTWGICTSSGTHGHSFSRGKADAVCVVSANTPLADAWATALANLVQGPADIEPVLADAPILTGAGRLRGIAACVIIVGDRVGVRGKFDLKPLN